MNRRPPRRGRPKAAGRKRPPRGLPSETLEVTVAALGGQGDGLAPWAGQTLYIPGVLPGERVRVKTGARRGDGVACTVLEVVEPASGRAEPVCPYYERCGGCALQHLDAPSYGAWKRGRVTEVLAKRGFDDVPVLDPVLIGPGTRRRVTFSAHKHTRRVDFGFNARASHDIVTVAHCPLLTPELDAVIQPLSEMLGEVLDGGQRVRVAVTGCENGADILIQADAPLGLAGRAAIAAFVTSGQAVRVAWQEPDFAPEPVAQAASPVVDLSGIEVELPMGAFLQASLAGEHAIRDRVLAGIDGAARVADLYCGLGSFTLPLARHAVVRAVDAVESAVKALERAAGRAGLGGRVLAEVRDLDRQPLDTKELAKFEAIVFDPPRAGAGAQVPSIAQADVARVVAVSCNPATFARDARVLVDGGFSLIEVQPIDQFTFSPHVELVAKFVRQAP